MSVAQELLRIRRMPYGTARTAAAEAAARRIEADGPREHLAEALLDLVEAYTFGGQGAKSFVVFARALRLWDASPELFDASDEHNLFWEFKWVASDLADYPQITAAHAEAFLEDMQRRFEVRGIGISAVLASRFAWAWQSGGPDAEERRLQWITTPRDDFDDCHACVIGRQTDFFVDLGRHEEAFELAAKQDGSCNIEPAKTFHAAALAALNLGKPEESLSLHHRAVASETRGNRDIASSRGQSFELLARGGHLERALRELRGDYREMLTDAPSPLAHLRFLIGLIAGLSANLDRGDLGTGIVMPGSGAGVGPGAGAGAETTGAETTGAETTVAELHAWAARQARELADALDGRSGTTFYGDQLARSLAATRVGKPLDFGPGFDAAGGQAVSRSGDTSGMRHADQAADPRNSAGGSAAGSAAGSAPGAPHTGAADAPRAPAASGAPGSTSGEDADGLLSRAGEAVGRKDYAAATRDYEQAGALLESGGWIERAGLAAAEAGQCAALDRNEERAHASFARALPLLRSGGADTGTLAAVLAAWAPVAARMNDAESQIRVTAAVLESHPEFDPDGLTEELATRKKQEWGAERATLRDTLARSLAATRGRSFGPGLDSERAAAEALRAGEEFAGLGMLADASHAFWLAGKVQADRGDTESAVWGLESAFEGFTAAGQRKDRLLVAGELIDLLKQTGQIERANQIVAEL